MIPIGQALAATLLTFVGTTLCYVSAVWWGEQVIDREGAPWWCHVLLVASVLLGIVMIAYATYLLTGVEG